MKKVFFLLFSLLIGIEPAFAQAQLAYMGRVKENQIFIYAGQHVNYEKLSSVKKDNTLCVLSESYGWLRVKLPIQAKVYVKAEHIQRLSDDVGRVTVDKLNARALPNTEASIVGKLQKDSKIVILDEKEGWFLIQPTDDFFGWVQAEAIEKTSQKAKARLYDEPVVKEKKEPWSVFSSDFIQDFEATSIEAVGLLIKEEGRFILQGSSSQDRLILQAPFTMLIGFQDKKVKVVGEGPLLSNAQGEVILNLIKVTILFSL